MIKVIYCANAALNAAPIIADIATMATVLRRVCLCCCCCFCCCCCCWCWSTSSFVRQELRSLQELYELEKWQELCAVWELAPSDVGLQFAQEAVSDGQFVGNLQRKQQQQRHHMLTTSNITTDNININTRRRRNFHACLLCFVPWNCLFGPNASC